MFRLKEKRIYVEHKRMLEIVLFQGLTFWGRDKVRRGGGGGGRGGRVKKGVFECSTDRYKFAAFTVSSVFIFSKSL